MNFRISHQRLVAMLRERVMNGEISERRLAQLTGISQPHMHNVLKGHRILSNRAADCVLMRLHLSLSDFADTPTAGNHTEVPVLEGCLGPGLPLPAELSKWEQYPFSKASLSSMVRPVLARLAEDALSAGSFRAGDLVPVDSSPDRRLSPEDPDYFVINRDGEGLVRRISIERDDLLLLRGAPMAPATPTVLPLQGCHLLDVVRARVAWVGRFLSAQAPRVRPAAWL
jgi:hypothetical protein